MVDSRMVQIVELLQLKGSMTSRELSEELGVSQRTVWSLIKRHEIQLAKNNLAIVAKPGTGIFLKYKTSKDVLNFISQPVKSGSFSQADRTAYFLKMLFSNEYITIESLADQLFLSTRSVSKVVRDGKEILKKFNLALENKAYRGMQVVGDELDIRRCLASVSSKGATTADLNNDFLKIETIVIATLSDFSLAMSDLAFNSLVRHILVMVERVRSGKILGVHEAAILKVSSDRSPATALSKALEIAFDTTFPSTEIDYLNLLLTLKKSVDSADFVVAELSDLSHSIVTSMLEVVSTAFNIDFRHDEELKTSLINHIIPLISRIKIGQFVDNPLLAEIKKNHPFAYIVGAQASTVVKQATGSELTEGEIGYLALLFALAIERNRSLVEKKKVLIICGSGYASANLLKYQYLEIFDYAIESIETCEVYRLKEKNLKEYDLILTTVPLDLDGVDVILIGDFLDVKDRHKVQAQLNKHEPNVVSKFDERLFFPHFPTGNKKEILERLVTKISRVIPLPKDFLQLVLVRDSLGPTAFGNLVAIPHPISAITSETFVAVGILDKPIEWDGKDVQVVFLLSVKKGSNKDLKRFFKVISNYMLDIKRIEDLVSHQNFSLFVKDIEDLERSTSSL